MGTSKIPVTTSIKYFENTNGTGIIQSDILIDKVLNAFVSNSADSFICRQEGYNNDNGVKKAIFAIRTASSNQLATGAALKIGVRYMV
jgi:hypothetical protein